MREDQWAGNSQGICASLASGERRFWNNGGECSARSQLTLSPRCSRTDLRRLSSAAGGFNFSSQVRSPMGESCRTPNSPPHAHQPPDGHSPSFPSPKSPCHPLHIFKSFLQTTMTHFQQNISKGVFLSCFVNNINTSY